MRCKNCHENIVEREFLGRPYWTHQPSGAAFQDGQHDYCHLKVAEPDV